MLVPNEQVVEVVEFESADPALQGELMITTTVADADGGTVVTAVHEGLSPSLSSADKRTGMAFVARPARRARRVCLGLTPHSICVPHTDARTGRTFVPRQRKHPPDRLTAQHPR